jgi:WD40 repeat protein
MSRDDVHLAVGSLDRTITIWDTTTQRPTHVLTGHSRAVGQVFYTPDGRLLGSAGFDGTARIWDPTTGRLLRTLHQPGSLIGGPNFTADGRFVATGNAATGVVRIWDTCNPCGAAEPLLALARTRITRQLTPLERQTFNAGS